MELEITPTWDRDQAVALTLCRRRRELVVRAPGEISQYVLCSRKPHRLGWFESRLADGQAPVRRAVTVGAVMCACLQEWEAEQAVLELTQRAAERAAKRGGPWAAPARRLRAQAEAGRQRRRVSTLPLQVLWHHHSHPHRDKPLSASLAAERIGFTADGRPDTTRLYRRLGLADHQKGGGYPPVRQRTVSYDTALTLCDALDVDPAEVGL